MVRDNTKHSAKGIVKKLRKARLVQEIVENYIDKSKMSYSVLQKVWFDDLQGGKGVIKKLNEISKKNERNYYVKTPITLSDGTKIAVCNQWEKENISNFILHADLLGFKIKAEGTHKWSLLSV